MDNVTRREFTKLGALGLAAQAMPAAVAQAQQADARTGYAVIGLGRIADHFLRATRDSKTSRVTGLVSGHRDKALRIAAEYGVPESAVYSYEDMDRMKDNQQIQAVYVALPNSMHAEYTLRSAKAGKHVLCEKPMAISVAECEAMIGACKAANVKLMIAYRCQYDPLHLKAIQLIRDGNIGTLNVIQGAFGGPQPVGEWRITKKLGGGGSLMDLGIYPLNASRYLAGEEPVEFKAFTSTNDHDGRFNEVEENITWTMRFPSGVLANCTSSYGAHMPGYFKVAGSKGWIEMAPAYNYDGMRLRASYRNADGHSEEIDETSPDKDPIEFVRQMDHFTTCIRQNQTPHTPGEEGLRDMEHMKAIYKSAGIDIL
ncbi:MAG: Gfo/Idh/MocA family oxidoreductase [Acidobacteriota bacterium]|nr:Gfo/Idh/MocA family oxidoreductase [Acidobacteriota bacterium]